MKQKETEEQTEIVVPDGYDIFDMLDTDDEGYELGNPIKAEEVKIKIE